MTVPPVIKVNKEAYMAAERDFEISYGRAVARWSRVESALASWFARATGMPEKMALPVFYSALGFRPRAEMLEVAIEHTTNCSPDELALIKEGIKRARKYSEFRNRLVHGDPTPWLDLDDPMKVSIVIAQSVALSSSNPTEGHITPAQMKNANNNLRKLSEYLSYTLGGVAPRLRLTPQQALSLVLALPSEAHLENRPTSAKSKQSPAAQERADKKAYRAAQKAAKQKRDQ